MIRTPKNYLNNKDMLLEIHRSKTSHCSFTEPSFHQYDIIVTELSDIDTQIIELAQKNKAKRMSEFDYSARKATGEKIKISECEFEHTSIPTIDLIFRVMTYDHIPLNSTRKKNPKTEADLHDKVNFKPFQHWKYSDNDTLICVGKSHWRGDLITGHFDKNAGIITDTLARMMIKLCERYATRGNVRGYTYNDEMKGQAILQLAQIGLQFDEVKSDNPFAYFTAACTNAFVRVINIEKRNQNIRDDILEMNGLNPSFTRTNSGGYEADERRHRLEHE
jgi:hypothetical protein